MASAIFYAKINAMTRQVAIYRIFFVLGSGSFVLGSCSPNGQELKNSRYYRELLLEIAETIIPRTDTPGAKDAGICDYMIDIIDCCLTKRDRNTILTGLNDLQKYTKSQYSLSFVQCTKHNKFLALNHFEQKGKIDSAFFSKVKNKLFGPSFFELIKNLTVKCYCASKVGATQGLEYDHVPGSYLACTPLLSDQRSWATA